MPVHRDDPYGGFHFAVVIDGDEEGRFAEVELPEGRIEAIAYREGSDTTSAARLLPGRVSYGPLVLRRGFAGDDRLFRWFQAVAQGGLDRRDVRVVLQNEAREPVATWSLRRAWPMRYAPGPLRALGNEVAIETLELAHEGLELE